MNNHVSIEQFMNSSLEVSPSLEATVRLIPVNLLLNIIKKENYYQAFINNFENNEHIFGNDLQIVYAIAIKQFIDTVNKNNYDFQLTNEDHERINYIIENYAPEEQMISFGKFVENNSDINMNLGNKRINIKSIFNILKDDRTLRRLFNSIDANKEYYNNFTNKEILECFGELLNYIIENFTELNIYPEDPDLYRLFIISYSFSLSDYFIKEDQLPELIPRVDDRLLTIILSNKTVSLEVKKKLLENMNDYQLSFVYNNMELNERNKLAESLGIWKIDEEIKRRIELIDNYVNNELIPILKKVFNGYISDEKYNELLNINLYYTSSGYKNNYNYSDKSLATNNGTNTTIDIESPFLKEMAYPDLILLDAITHEAIHSISSTIKGTGFKTKREYIGINEAITQYLAETALGENSYVKATGEAYCGYQKSVLFIEKLVGMEVFTIEELAYNYVNNKTQYLQDAITKYTDIYIYHEIIQCFNKMNKSENYEERKEAENKLDRILVELREKIKKVKKENVQGVKNGRDN